MTQQQLEEHAYRLLKSDPDYRDDAEAGIAGGNTVIGSVMSITIGAPRWASEEVQPRPASAGLFFSSATAAAVLCVAAR
jgi:hypothetical protein